MLITEKVAQRFDAEWEKWAPNSLDLQIMSSEEILWLKTSYKSWFLMGAAVTFEEQVKELKEA